VSAAAPGQGTDPNITWRACAAQVAFARRQLARAEDEARAQRRRVADFVERRGWGAVAAPALGVFVLASLFGARPPVPLCSPALSRRAPGGLASLVAQAACGGALRLE
jgi:hypothetical protein